MPNLQIKDINSKNISKNVLYAVIIKGMDYDRFKMCQISIEKAT